MTDAKPLCANSALYHTLDYLIETSSALSELVSRQLENMKESGWFSREVLDDLSGLAALTKVCAGDCQELMT